MTHAQLALNGAARRAHEGAPRRRRRRPLRFPFGLFSSQGLHLLGRPVVSKHFVLVIGAPGVGLADVFDRDHLADPRAYALELFQ